MINYDIEIQRDIEYIYFSYKDLFLILALSEMKFYNTDLSLVSKSEFSANSHTSLVFNLDDTSNAKSIGNVGEMAATYEIAYRKCIEKINQAIKNNRSINEKILHSNNIPVLLYEDFKPLKLTRMIKFIWYRSDGKKLKSNIYISDKDNNIKEFLIDGSSDIFEAVNDEEIIKTAYNIFARGKANDKVWELKEIRKLLLYPTIKQMY